MTQGKTNAAKARQGKKMRGMTAAERRQYIAGRAAFLNFCEGTGKLILRDEKNEDGFPRFVTYEQFKEEGRALWHRE